MHDKFGIRDMLPYSGIYVASSHIVVTICCCRAARFCDDFNTHYSRNLLFQPLYPPNLTSKHVGSNLLYSVCIYVFLARALQSGVIDQYNVISEEY